MAKSNVLVNRIKNFADKLSGTSYVDNAANPASAYSMMQRGIKNAATTNPKSNFATKQKTFGVPGTK